MNFFDTQPSVSPSKAPTLSPTPFPTRTPSVSPTKSPTTFCERSDFATLSSLNVRKGEPGTGYCPGLHDIEIEARFTGNEGYLDPANFVVTFEGDIDDVIEGHCLVNEAAKEINCNVSANDLPNAASFFVQLTGQEDCPVGSRNRITIPKAADSVCYNSQIETDCLSEDLGRAGVVITFGGQLELYVRDALDKNFASFECQVFDGSGNLLAVVPLEPIAGSSGLECGQGLVLSGPERVVVLENGNDHILFNQDISDPCLSGLNSDDTSKGEAEGSNTVVVVGVSIGAIVGCGVIFALAFTVIKKDSNHERQHLTYGGHGAPPIPPSRMPRGLSNATRRVSRMFGYGNSTGSYANQGGSYVSAESPTPSFFRRASRMIFGGTSGWAPGAADPDTHPSWARRASKMFGFGWAQQTQDNAIAIAQQEQEWVRQQEQQHQQPPGPPLSREPPI